MLEYGPECKKHSIAISSAMSKLSSETIEDYVLRFYIYIYINRYTYYIYI